jgi:lysylphosphatidylglycerol synthetase-like protein (DUF2156 family)
VLLAAHGLLYPFLFWARARQEFDVVHVLLGMLLLAGAAALITGGRRRYRLAVLATAILLMLGVIASIGTFTLWSVVYTASTLPAPVLLVLCRPAPRQVDSPSRIRRFFTALANIILVLADSPAEERPWRDGCLPLLIFAVSFLCLVTAPPVLFIEKQLIWGLGLLAVGIVPPVILFRKASVYRRKEQRRIEESVPEIERYAKPDDEPGRP